MIVRQHFPNFISGVTPEEAEVSTQQELLALPWIHRLEWEHGFKRWSVASHVGRWKRLLMVEFDDASYFVIAYLDGDMPLDLPQWEDRHAESCS